MIMKRWYVIGNIHVRLPTKDMDWRWLGKVEVQSIHSFSMVIWDRKLSYERTKFNVYTNKLKILLSGTKSLVQNQQRLVARSWKGRAEAHWLDSGANFRLTVSTFSNSCTRGVLTLGFVSIHISRDRTCRARKLAVVGLCELESIWTAELALMTLWWLAGFCIRNSQIYQFRLFVLHLLTQARVLPVL